MNFEAFLDNLQHYIDKYYDENETAFNPQVEDKSKDDYHVAEISGLWDKDYKFVIDFGRDKNPRVFIDLISIKADKPIKGITVEPKDPAYLGFEVYSVVGAQVLVEKMWNMHHIVEIA